MGFPLDRGTVKDGILTCHWHHARFDLINGGTFDQWAGDVLSFPVKAEAFEKEEELNLGEVVVCLQRASEQAKQNQISFQVEVKQLILHGLLHLSGYDHETDNGEMDRLELRLRKRLGIA